MQFGNQIYGSHAQTLPNVTQMLTTKNTQEKISRGQEKVKLFRILAKLNSQSPIDIKNIIPAYAHIDGFQI